MKAVPMTRWAHSGLLGLIVGLSFVCIASGCRKKEESSSATQAAAVASVFTARSRVLVEEVRVHPTSALTPKGIQDEAEDLPDVSVSAHADPTSGGAPLTVNFSSEVSDAPTGVQYRWDFGDHSEPSGRLKVQHTYASAGDYTATFSVTGQGVSESQDVRIKVTKEGFDLDVNADPDIGTAPLNVEFIAMPDGDLPQPVSFQWDFGDGDRDVSNPAHHTYQEPGQYTASVLVTNGLGQVARRELEIQVDPREEGDDE
jgi:cellulose 1,4-beta-cellobiosidase